MSYSYDNNFNLTSTGAFYGMYDASNHLVSASNSGSTEAPGMVAEFVYDGLGRCVKRTLNGVVTVFVYDGWKPIAEWYAEKPDYFQAWNVYGPGADEILLRQQGKYGYIRFQLDRHGNVAFLLDNDGALKEKCSYDAFGRPKVTDSDDENPRTWSYYGHGFLFQGREYLWELGIYDYRNRLYFPETGRFLQTDPKGFDAGDMNLFRYCGDGPVDGSDPTGLSADLIYIGNMKADIPVRMGADGLTQRKDRIVVSAHATADYIMNSNWNHTWNHTKDGKKEVPENMRLPIDQLVREIKVLKKYTPNITIRLDMCHAGDFEGAKNNVAVAQKVANAFGTNPISANTGVVNAFDEATTGTNITFWGPASGHTTELPIPGKYIRDSGHFVPNTLGSADGKGQDSPAYGQLSSQVSTGGGGWATEGYFPGGGEAGEGFHPVTFDKN